MERLELTEAENLKKFYFYQAILIVIEAVRNFASRYSELALAQAAGLEKGEPDEMRRAAELREMARILSKVPYEPAESFAEALQSMWLNPMAIPSPMAEWINIFIRFIRRILKAEKRRRKAPARK